MKTMEKKEGKRSLKTIKKRMRNHMLCLLAFVCVASGVYGNVAYAAPNAVQFEIEQVFELNHWNENIARRVLETDMAVYYSLTPNNPSYPLPAGAEGEFRFSLVGNIERVINEQFNFDAVGEFSYRLRPIIPSGVPTQAPSGPGTSGAHWYEFETTAYDIVVHVENAASGNGMAIFVHIHRINVGDNGEEQGRSDTKEDGIVYTHVRHQWRAQEQEPDDDDDDDDDPPPPRPPGKPVQTGDDTNMLLWYIAGIAGVGIMVAMVIMKKRKQRKD